MRLLTLQDDGNLTLTKDFTSDTPFYAILSHTWGPDDEEVTFKDIVEGAGYHKNGYKKIRFCGRQAASDGLRYFWVDSCCIDKSNNTELSQAINSMFRWYHNAAKCYVYLSDVSSGGCQSDGPVSWESTFRKSRWFRRGWTLQELIAPRLVEFFSVEGQRLGDKVTLERELHEITRIATSALRGIPLSDFSRKERMLWAQDRTTKLEEDRAYCLLGIFQVYLPLIYGEGVKNAFRRLEEEIDKQATFKRSRLDDDQGLKPDSLPVVPLSLKDAEESCLRSLWFPSINTRRLNLEKPADQTYLWLFEHEVYQNWFMHRNQDKNGGLLWLKGKPGTGKSVLMKEAFRRAVLGQEKSIYCTAAFFFNAKGDKMESSPLGLFRSLLYQLLPRNPEHLQRFRKLWDERKLGCSENGLKSDPWQEPELRDFFQSMFTDRKAIQTIIFIDALDECEYNNIQSQANFWRSVTSLANNNETRLSVCFSTRSIPNVTLIGNQGIVVEDYNYKDIARYVTERFTLSIADKEPQWEFLKYNILKKSAGVFLWVVLVVDDVLRGWDDGKSVQSLLKQLDVVPEELETLFSTMLSSIDKSTRDFTIRFFQWAVLSARPLHLHEWHHIMAFIRQPAPSSLHNWRKSLYFTRDDDQLEKQIRSISKGLIQVSTRDSEVENENLETLSVCAGAGSLDIEYGETRIVQVIHESVRQFFLQGNGFFVVNPNLWYDPIGYGHYSIIGTCLDYIIIKELDALVQARNLIGEVGDNGSIEYQRDSTFEQLKSSDCFPIDVAGWMGLPTVPGDIADQITRNKWSPCVSTASPSAKGQSQVLEDYPALLSYATFELFTHARLAEIQGADPSGIINRLTQNGVWARWVTLREDLPPGVALGDYATSQGLTSWIRRIRSSRGSPNPLSTPQLFHIVESYEATFVKAPSSKAPKRPRSVASFSSAGSHRGTNW